MKWPTDSRLKKLNWLLLAVILLCNFYVLALPFLPKAEYKIKRLVKPAPAISIDKSGSLSGIDRNVNQLVIPSIELVQSIHDGHSPYTVNKGIWRKPDSATPDKSSNTVLVGHRFSYKNPSVFYLLDEIKKGDEIFTVWNKKMYAYQVEQVQVVSPKATEIEAPTDQSRLTIYTCTPVWSTKQRLVVQAKLIKVLP